MNSLVQPFRLADSDFRIDFIDSYSRTFVAPCKIAVESTVKEFFFSVPKFTILLFQIREFIGKRLGLKTANGKTSTLVEIQQFRGNVGDKIALFEVWERNEEEIVTGQRDKHLDFVLIFRLTGNESAYNLELTTAVQINGILGKLYFAAVKPVHALMMPILIKKLCKRLVSAC